MGKLEMMSLLIVLTLARQAPEARKAATPMPDDFKILADGFPNDLSYWFECEPPTSGTREIAANNDLEHEWVVSLLKDRPEVRLASRWPNPPPMPFAFDQAKEAVYGHPSIAKVDDGWIIGFNQGEFGASLWWFSPDGKERRRISKNVHWVNQFFRTDVGLLATVGLAHGTTSEGRIIRMARDADGRWRVEHLVNLGAAPYAALLEADGSMLVATSKSLLRVNLAEKKIKIFLDHVFWGILYPNSLIVDASGTIFVGMRHGVAKVKKVGMTYKARWLVPDISFERAPVRPGFH